MDPVGSPPKQQQCELYHTTIFCGVLVALGFFAPARSFTSGGTSSAEHRIERPHLLGFNLQGAARGTLAPWSWGLFGEMVWS